MCWSCVTQGDGGWDLLGALDHLKRYAEETQDEHTLTATAFLEKRVQKVWHLLPSYNF